MTIEIQKKSNINRIALLYRDLLSSTIKPLDEKDKQLLLNIQPVNKVVAIGDIDLSNWNTYALTYLLDRKLVAPTVLDESKIYQSIQGMRTHNESVAHPQTLISQSVVIRIIGLDNSANINDYINSFISACIASDECKIVFVIFDGNKKFYKDKIYVRKTNSTFIETSTGKPYVVESSPLCISPDQITFFNYSKKLVKQEGVDISNKMSDIAMQKSVKKKNSCSSMFSDPDMF
jgi:hypothetical protein